jgi:hypothetical protein
MKWVQNINEIDYRHGSRELLWLCVSVIPKCAIWSHA